MEKHMDNEMEAGGRDHRDRWFPKMRGYHSPQTTNCPQAMQVASSGRRILCVFAASACKVDRVRA